MPDDRLVQYLSSMTQEIINEEQQKGIYFVAEDQIPINFGDEQAVLPNTLRLLSLFSGCGGMDIGFEGGFIAPKKSFSKDSSSIERVIDD